MARELQLKYFNDTIYICGKHKEMVDKLWEQNKISNSFFKRLSFYIQNWLNVQQISMIFIQMQG